MLSRTILRFTVIMMMAFISLCSGFTQATDQRLKLSEQEQAFLASLDVIRVCTDPMDWMSGGVAMSRRKMRIVVVCWMIGPAPVV